MSPSALHSRDVIVVGGGPAGVAAATDLAAAGLGVELFEQGPRLGGAIHRQPAAPDASAPAAGQWRRLSRALAASGAGLRTRLVFLGIDADGLALFDDRTAGRVIALRARAVVLAVGAVERVSPRPGWDLPGVTTAGGMQVMMKETGRAPGGRILLAGTGPLPIALAAQLARLGNPPVAVIESGDPFRHIGAGLSLLAHPAIFAEAVTHLARLYAAGIPWRRGASLTAIRREGEDLVATVRRADGRDEEIRVDRITLHDGIRPNDFGLPDPRPGAYGAPLVVHAGDCRETLGARAAEADGRRAAATVIGALRGRGAWRSDWRLRRERRAQAVLAALFRSASGTDDFADLPDETILCRCEGRTVGDLRRLLADGDALSPREVKLNGRFGMGACQGRFCAETTAAFVASACGGQPAAPRDLVGRRWPVRPVPIAALIASPADGEQQPE